MTDELIILNRCNGYNGEGFFKFEDVFTKMTVAFKATEDSKNALWYVDGHFAPFEKTAIVRTSSPVNSMPKNCGIFTVNNSEANLILFFGDKETLCRDFYLKSGNHKRNQQVQHSIRQSDAAQKKETVFANTNDNGAKNTDKNTDTDTDNNANAGNSVSTTETTDTSAETGTAVSTDIKQNNTDGDNCVITESVLCKNPVSDIPDSFWDVNRDSFNKIFENSPKDEYMSTLIPGSKWVHCKENNYILGIIYDEYSSPMYLCYGFSLPWSEEVPEKLEGYSQWIPKDCSHPHDDGYWVVYINAKTGERVK